MLKNCVCVAPPWLTSSLWKILEDGRWLFVHKVQPHRPTCDHGPVHSSPLGQTSVTLTWRDFCSRTKSHPSHMEFYDYLFFLAHFVFLTWFVTYHCSGGTHKYFCAPQVIIIYWSQDVYRGSCKNVFLYNFNCCKIVNGCNTGFKFFIAIKIHKH